MTDHDALFKRLLTTFLREFLELFLPDVLAYTDLSEAVFLDKELPRLNPKSKKRAADVVARVRWLGQDAFFLLHAEPQSTQQDHFNQRMFYYFSRLYEKYKLPVYPIGLLTFDSPRAVQPEALQVTFPDLPVLDFRFRVIQLNRLSWRDFINQTNPIAAALMTKMRIDKKDRPRVKAECVRMMLTGHLEEEKQSLIWEFVDTYLQLSEKEEKTFRQELATIAPEVEEDTMELMTSWEKRGWKRGLKEGEQKGRQKGLKEGEQKGQQVKAQEIVLRQLQLKLGPLSASLGARLQALSLMQLDQLSVDLFTFATTRDLAAWLKKQPPQQLQTGNKT